MLSLILGLDLVDGSFFLREGIDGYNKSVRSDGVIVAWKAATPSILYSFYQVLGAPSWFER